MHLLKPLDVCRACSIQRSEFSYGTYGTARLKCMSCAAEWRLWLRVQRLDTAGRVRSVCKQHWARFCACEARSGQLYLAAALEPGKRSSQLRNGHHLHMGHDATLNSSCTHLRQVTPHTAYIVAARAWLDSGSGLAGVTFYDGVGTRLTSSGVRITATRDSVVEAAVVAPPGAHFAALWAGKWAGGGELQVELHAWSSGSCAG